MRHIEMDAVEQKIKDKLTSWIDPEQLEDDVFKSHVLIYHYNQSAQSAIALVKYEDMIEIDFLFYSLYGNRAEISCDQRIRLFDEEVEGNKEKNKVIIETTKSVFETLIKRLGY